MLVVPSRSSSSLPYSVRSKNVLGKERRYSAAC